MLTKRAWNTRFRIKLTAVLWRKLKNSSSLNIMKRKISYSGWGYKHISTFVSRSETFYIIILNIIFETPLYICLNKCISLVVLEVSFCLSCWDGLVLTILTFNKFLRKLMEIIKDLFMFYIEDCSISSGWVHLHQTTMEIFEVYLVSF